jgi:alanine racemase
MSSGARLTTGRPAGVPIGTTSWLEIDTAALHANVSMFRRRLEGGSMLAAVVKSNAYGHGLEICAPIALQAGASWLAVGGLSEALALRQQVGADVPVLTLNHVPPADLASAVEHGIRVTLYDQTSVASIARAAAAQQRPGYVHLKLETGTHRQGVEPDRVIELAGQIARTPQLVFDGLSTHFADIEDTTDHRYAESQRTIFESTLRQLEALGLAPRMTHIACSAATILFPETHQRLARAGIGLYGFWPSRETLVSARERGLGSFALSPVMSWRCLIAQVKDVPVGGYVGYGRTWRASRASRIAVLPIGYFEGYPRSLSGRAHVLIDGRRAPVVGRICMNMTMVDVTDIPAAQAGETATLLGSSGDESVRAEDLATWAGTIHYEIVSRLHASLPRVAIG